MTIDSDFSDLDSCDLKSDITWDALYRFLTRRVRYWILSAHVSLWRGQEEDIVADIVQETVTRTFTYWAEYLSYRKQGGIFPCDLLKRMSMFIACSHYLEMERQDARFLYTRQRVFSSQRFTIVHERVDPVEVVIDNVTQEWYCNLLVERIVEIPPRPRIALLIDLANHTHFSSRPTKLQYALQKAGIQLQCYRQTLPQNPVVRNGYNLLLSFAYRRIMRKQERLEELENTEEIRDSQEPSTTTSNSDADLIHYDPELAMLETRLEQSAPRAPIDPAFKKALRDQLLDILAKHRVQVSESLPTEETPELPGAQDNPGAVDTDQHSAPQDSDPDAVWNDPELAMLEARLEQSAPRAPIDPAFKKALRDQLLDIQAKHRDVPMPTEETSELLGAQDNPGAVDTDQHSVPQDSDPDAVQNTFPTALVEHLEATAPSAAGDPAFKKALRDQLLDIQTKHHVPVSEPLSIEEIRLETEKVFDSNSEESHHLSTRRRRHNH